MFAQLTDKIDYNKLELQILEFWEKENIFNQSVDSRKGKKIFSFFEGPPTANGRPGLHHIMSRTLKDAFCRYKTMKGFYVPRKAGWDTHGLPVEIEVEKSLGIKNKDEIVTYGIEKFNAECKKSVWKYKTEWEKLTREMGYWVDMSSPYITFENNYIESVWWALSEYYNKGMIYKGFKIQPYCPRCETPLSSHEISLGYKNVTDNSIYIKFKLVDEVNTFILSWTTTPWTLPGNVALAVGEKIDYVKLKVGEEIWIIAKDLTSALGEEYPIVEKIKGKDLVGKKYISLFDVDILKSEKSFTIYDADFVTTTDGTGVVHTAVMYGEDDYQLGKKIGLPQHHTVDKSGHFTNDIKGFDGLYVKDKETEKKIIIHLKTNNNYVKTLPYAHEYPHCWRCSFPLLYYARNSWYISTTKYSSEMISINNTINWFPKEVGVGRFGNWLEENKDWALSRDRYWGTPLPIWICESCNKQKIVGSISELQKGENVPQEIDLHKPFVDKITFKCSCGSTMFRTPEVIDAWFDSGSMPFAQLHYPFENKEQFEASYPADYISEGIDQTRGWFYTLHAIGSFLFKKPAFKNVLVNELILDKQGQKMSKSKGNTVDPFVLMKKFGADTTRWYLVINSPVWRPTLFDEDGIAEVQRKLFNTLLNTYSFFTLYANIDGFIYSEAKLPINERLEIDRWILSSLNSLILISTEAMESYDITKSARAINNFVINDLSNWYIRRNRRRFWKSENGKDKTAAYQTLFECLIKVSELMAPISPFISDLLYKNLTSVINKNHNSSVHLAEYPIADKNSIDNKLEDDMNMAVTICEHVRAMRMKANLKIRQPLQRILIPIIDEKQKLQVERMKEIILDEINVKEISFVSEESGIVKKKAKANFRTLGVKFGKGVQPIATAIKELNSKQISELQRNNKINLSIDGNNIEIVIDDVEIIHEGMIGFMVESNNIAMVALDTTLTPELLQEGLAREFVNRIQNMRKDANFNVMDRIAIYFKGTVNLEKALINMENYIKIETLATNLSNNFVTKDFSAEDEINGEKCSISIEKVVTLAGKF
ncbi:MAG: isoleucine--tRNA ligase [Ignavibacteria bacterium]|nr:isoleucine--tRNA ligase [Bacteroidota bacterium]MSQ46323.1 isoleucine--tRNA ligase [Ignavibacteria bacterium]